MSYHTWSIDGYGFSVENISTTEKRIENLLREAPIFHETVKESFRVVGITNPNIDDYLSYGSGYRLAYMIQQVIKEAEQINVDIATDFDEFWYVLLCPSYPWSEIGVKERSLTKDRLKEIFEYYISILTDSKIEINYQSVENGG